MAAAVIAASGSHVSTNGTNAISVPVPSGMASGSKVVVRVGFVWNTTTTPTTAAITPPTGFTLGYSQNFTDSADSYVMLEAWYEKTATAADTGTYAFSAATVGGAAASSVAGVAHRITGASDPALGDTLHVSPTATSQSGITIPTFTPAHADSLLICGITTFGNAIGGGTIPSGWSTVGSAIGSGFGATYTAQQPDAPASATGSLAFTIVNGGPDYTWGTIATILPAGTVVPVTGSVSSTTPKLTGSISGTVSTPAVTGTLSSSTPRVTGTITGSSGHMSGETSRVNGTTSGGTAYIKITGTLGSDGYVGYFPASSSSNINLVIWNHPYDSPYDQDIAGTGDSGWTFALTSYLLDHGIAIVAGNDAGDQFGGSAVMTSISSLYTAVNGTYSVGKVMLYGESMGGAATLNWTARNPSMPIIGAMLISGVCDTSLFTSGFGTWTYDAAYNPMLETASGWTGLPLFMASSPQDNTVNEAANTDDFITHLGGVATVTHVETTGDHLTAGNYPTTQMESFFTTQFASSPVSHGTLAASTPKVTGSITGTLVGPVTGIVDALLHVPTSSIAGTLVTPVSGTVTARTPVLTASLSGTVTQPNITGTLTARTPLARSSITGNSGASTLRNIRILSVGTFISDWQYGELAQHQYDTTSFVSGWTTTGLSN